MRSLFILLLLLLFSPMPPRAAADVINRAGQKVDPLQPAEERESRTLGQRARAKEGPYAEAISAFSAVPPDPELVAKARPLLKKPATYAEADAQARELLEMLTPEERFMLIGGARFASTPVTRIGLPSLLFANASGGLNNPSLPFYSDPLEKATGFPAPIMVAATWNPELAQEYGRAIAEEFRAAGLHFILGPGMNVQRISRCGRNFEYFGEDPLLIGEMASAYVRAAQKVGVATTIKHFIANNNEFMRRGTNVIVDERTLQEIYMPGFLAAVEAGAWAVMTSYNLINGEWAGQSSYVIRDLLREQMGFKHLVMTDWDSVTDGAAVIRSGQDLEMPYGMRVGAVKEDFLGSPQVDAMVLNLLRTGIVSGLYEAEAAGAFREKSWTDRLPEHLELSRKIVEQGATLLKNGGILPLKPERLNKVLVSGNWAQVKEISGGGTSHVPGYDQVTYLQAVQEQWGAENVTYAAEPSDEQIKEASLVLMFTGHPLKSKGEFNHETEGRDVNFLLIEDALIARCTQLNPNTIVCLTLGGGVQMDWAEEAGAIVHAYFGGQAAAPVLVDLLMGKRNFSGRLPFTIEKKFEDSPGFGYDVENPDDRTFDRKEMPLRIAANMVKGEGGKVHQHNISYDEGVLVGYRWFYTKGIEPRFSFGHGLTYTSFAYEDLKLEKTGDAEVTVRFRVRNTGARDGAEVAQIYVGDPEASVLRPLKELKAFRRLEIPAGESVEVEIPLASEAFRFWSPESKDWVLEPGKFVIMAGSSSGAIHAQAEVSLGQP